VENDWNDNDIICGKVIPSFGNATLSYRLALELSKKLHCDEAAIAEFDQWYETEVREMKIKRKYEDEETKPVFNWKKFRNSEVLKKASIIATKNRFSDASEDDSMFSNFKWEVEHERELKRLTIPQQTVQYSHDETKAIKKLVGILFHTESIADSIKNLLGNTQFARHGGDPAAVASEVRIIPELQYRSSVFNNHSYLELVWRYGVLKFCNYEHLLNSIGLRAVNLGFESYRFDEPSSYGAAKESFKKWYDASFMEEIDRDYGGSSKSHRMYHVYASISAFLDMRQADDGSRIQFLGFVSELFNYIFRRMDVEHQETINRTRFTAKLDGKLRFKYLKLYMDKIREKALEKQARGESGLLDVIEQELLLSQESDTIIQELLLPEQNELAKSVSELRKLDEHLIKALEGMGDG